MIHVWWSVKNLVNLKPVAAFNIPNDKSPSFASLERAALFEKQGTAAQLSGHYSSAKNCIIKAYRLYHQVGDSFGVIQNSLRLGDIHRQIENFHSAVLWYKNALASVQRWPTNSYSKNQMKADAELGLGLSWRGEGKYDKAMFQFHRVLKSYKKNKDQEGRAFTFWAMGSTSRFQGRFSSAEFFLRKSITLYQDLNDPSGLAYARAALGGTLRMMGNAIESGKLYRQAWQTFHRLHDQFGEAYTYCGQGNALRMQNKFSLALPFMNRAIQRYANLRQQGPLGYVLWSRAQLKITQKKFSAALRDLKKSELLFRKVRDKRGLIYCLLGLGEWHGAQQKKKNKLFFRRALKNSKKLKLSFETAHALHRLNNHASSLSLYKKCDVNLVSFLRYKTLP